MTVSKTLEVLTHARILSMFTLLMQRRLHWMGHVHHMADSKILKYILCSQWNCGKRGLGCPQLYFKDICKQDMKALDIAVSRWVKAHEGLEPMEVGAWQHPQER